MSVINQMLRDLEDRKVKTATSGAYIDEVNIIAPNPRGYWWLILLLLIVITLSVTIYLHLNNQNIAGFSTVTSERRMEVMNENPVPPELPGRVSEIEQKTVIPVEQNTSESVTLKEVKSTIPAQKYLLPVTVKTIPPEVEQAVIPQSESLPSVTIKTIIKSPEKAVDEVKPTEKIADINNKTVVKSAVIVPIRNKNNVSLMTEVIQQARLLMINDKQSATSLLENNLQKIDPDPDYYALLANLYQRQGRFDDAIIFYKKALKITPDKGELWIGIALAYQGTGEAENSQMAFKKAVISNINPTLKQYAVQKINN